MKKVLYLLMFLFFMPSLWAASPVKVSSEIKQVTVYIKGAVLKNMASVSLVAGRNTLLFTDLSYDTKRESIRIKGAGCKILNVSLKRNYLGREQLNAEIKVLQDEAAALTVKKEAYLADLDVFKEEKKMILSNQNIKGEQTGIDPEKLRAMADFYRTRLADILKEERKIMTELVKLEKRLGELEKQVSLSAAKNIYPSSEIEVELESDKQQKTVFEIEYFISQAGWTPAYDARVENLSTPLQLQYVANVYQNSGYDWKNVELTVSSSDPENNEGQPVLKPWKISRNDSRLQFGLKSPNAEISKVEGQVYDANTGEPIPFATIRVKNSSAGTVADIDGKYSLMLPKDAKTVSVYSGGYAEKELDISGRYMDIVLNSGIKSLESVSISNLEAKRSPRGSRNESQAFIDGVKTRGAADIKVLENHANLTASPVSFEYTLKEKMTIPSDGRPYTAQILTREIPAEFRHFATPRLSNSAFLSVFITEWEKLNLLEGEVNLYLGNAYAGKTAVSLKNMADTLELSMGKDPAVKISRQITYQKTNTGLFSGKTSTYKWSTEVRNTSASPVRITVSEPFPISVEKEIRVELDKDLTGAEVDREKGTLSWSLELQPSEQRKLVFGYAVTYPKDMILRFE